MKKLLFALTLVLCLAVSLVAFTSCGGGGNDDCEHIWATDATVDTAATCTQEGSQSIKCIECGEKKADSITAIPAYGHSYDDGTTVPATCLENGSVTKTCSVCGDVKTETIPAAGEHTWSAEPIIDTYATCTTDGAKSIKCTACQTVKPDTTEVIPAGHTWADAVSVVTPATCTTDGVAAIKCTVCREVKPETNEVIPATGHTDIDVVVAPTLFTEGRIKGTCSTCGVNVNEAIATTKPANNTINATHDKANTPQATASINDALGDKTFKPGVDLFLEFSILWNETMETTEGKGLGFGHIANNADVTNEGKTIVNFFSWLYYRPDATYCPFVGGFEFSEAKSFTYGPTWTASNNNADDFVIIEGLDGWHRIGLQYTQNVYEDNGEFTYDVTVTVYVDGVKESENVMDWGAMFYSAEKVNGEIVYTQNEKIADYYAVFYRIGNGALQEGNTDDAYFPIGECYLTVGDGFAKPVTKLDTPTEGTYSPEEGVTLPAKQYYAYVKSVNEMLYDETLDSVEYPVDMITPAEGTVDYSVNSGGTRYHKYLAHDSARVAFVNVKNIAFNTVNIGVADGASVRYTFFSKMPTEFGEVVSYAIQYRTFTTATADVSVEIPANAAYLVLYYQDNATTKYIPESLTFTNDPTTLSEQIKDNTLDTFNYPVDAIKPSQGTIAANNLQYIPNFDWVGTFIDIRDIAFEKVTLEVNATTGNISYTFLTQFPDIYDYVEFAEGCGPVVECKEQPAGTTYTVDIPEDAVCLYIYWHDEGPIYYIPNSITFTNTDADERTPLDNLQDPALNEYSYPMDQVLPSEGTIRYNGDHDYHPNEDYKVAFIEITDTVFDLVTLGIDPEIGYVGWTFLTEMPELNEVVSYATGYENHFCWNDNGCDPENVEIPEDAKYLVVYYQDSATDPYYPASITFTKAEPETPDEPVDDGTYSYPIASITPVDGFFSRQGEEAENKTCTYKVSTAGENVAFIDISELDYNTVTFLGNANKESGWYTFLTKMPTANDEKISYAMNYNKAIWFGLPDGPITVTIPDNAKYIAILYNYENGTPTYPQSIVFSNNENTPSENLKNDALDSYEYPMDEIKPSMGTIANDGNKFIQNYWWVGSYVGIEDCVFDKVVIEIGESGAFYYAFLTAYPELDKAVSFAGGATATIKVVGTAGDKVTIDIPDDAVCFYIYRHDWENNAPAYFLPESITFIKADDSADDSADDAENAGNTGNGGASEDAENAGNGGASEDAENAGNGGASEDAENAGNGGASEDAENAGNGGASEDAEENAGNGGASEDAEENAGNGGASEDADDSAEDSGNKPLIPGLGTATGNK